MAIDAELPAWARRRGCGVLRFYNWDEPSLTFGYSQRHVDVTAFAHSHLKVAPGTAMIRRPSGGGIVDHRNDLTYAFALPAEDPSYRTTSQRFYCLLHQALSDALERLSCPSALAPCDPLPPQMGSPSPGIPAACFAGHPAPSDVLNPHSGVKIAGAALRRNPDGILAQGSLDRRQLPPELSAADLQPVFAATLKAIFAFGGIVALAEWPESLPSATNQVQFASSAWNRRR